MNEKKFIKKIGKTINQYKLINAEDTIAVALSGGKDSYALLETLHLRLKHLPISYKLIGVHIDFGFNKKQVKEIQLFCKARNIECYIEKKKLDYDPETINCFWCSWNRRKALFEFTQREKITKLAFAHHLDDLIETLLLNMMYQSKFESIYPKTIFFKGKLEVLRPLIDITDKELLEYSRFKKFPVESHKCFFNIESKRNKIRKIIKLLYDMNGDNNFKFNIFSALKKLDYKT